MAECLLQVMWRLHCSGNHSACVHGGSTLCMFGPWGTVGSGLPPPSEIRPHSVGPFSEMTLSLLTVSRQFLGPPCFLCSGYKVFFGGVKQLMCDDRPPLSSAKVKNEWSYTFVPCCMPS